MIVNSTTPLDPRQTATPATLNKPSSAANGSGNHTTFASVLNNAVQQNGSVQSNAPTSGTGNATTNAPAASTSSGTPSGAASASSTANSTASTAALINLLMQSQLDNLLTSSLGSTGSSSLSGLGSGLGSGLLGGTGGTSSLLSLLSEASVLQGATGSTSSSSSLASELIPLLLGSTANLSGTSGLGGVGTQSPLGALSSSLSTLPTTVVAPPPAPSANPTVSPSSSAGTEASVVDKSTIQSWVNEYAPRFGLNPKLVNAVITQESGFSPSATSSAGAMGLMQLMPETAAMLGVTNPYNPFSNLMGGMKYLSGLVNHYQGNIPLALAAYNAGSHAVSEYGGIPPYPETQRYVADVMAMMNS